MAATSPGDDAELTRLQRRLDRERKVRFEAEAIAETTIRELYEKHQEVVLLERVAIAANEASTVEDALQVTLDQVCVHTGWPVGHAYLLAEDSTGELVSTHIWRIKNPGQFETLRKVTEGTRFAPGVGLPGRVLASGKPAWIMDVTKDPNFMRAKTALDIGVRAGFAFPALVGTEVAAVLEFFSDRPVEPADRLLEVMALVGTHLGRVVERKRAEKAQAALALENARLYHETQQQLRQTGTLLAVAQALSSTQDLTEVVRRTLRETVRALGADVGIAWRLNPSRDALIPLAGYHVPKDLLEPYSHTVFPRFSRQQLVAEARRLDEPIYSSDSQSDPRFDHPLARLVPHKSILVFPMRLKDQIIGGFAVAWLREAHHFTAEELRLVEGIARQAAMAIENARLYQEAQTRVAALRQLAQLNQLVTSSPELQQILDSVTESVLDPLQGDLARLWVVEEEAGVLRLVALKGDRGDLRPPTTEFPIGHGLVGWVVEHKTKRYSPNLLEDPLQVNKEWVSAQGYVSQIAVPLVAGERAVGALVVLTKAPREFSQEEEDLLQIFATRAATLLENVSMYQKVRKAYEDLSRTQEQLIQSQKMEAVGKLAGGLAHDFNNLLTVLIGRSQLLLKRLRQEDPLRPDIQLIQEIADRAASLTRQLLAFSRKQVLAPKVLDLNAVLAQMDTLLRRLISEDIDLVIVPGPELGRVKADPAQLEQVLVNLAVNARDAMPRGGRLTIETANVELDEAYAHRHVGVQPGRYVMFAVSDTGVGMDAETKARIFEPFFTTKELGKGTGLGLSTVYGIVKQSGGNIWVYSEPGQGATFKIYLPRVGEAVDSIEQAPTAAPRGSETLLLVEDNDAVRELARDVLKGHGYTVLEARHGGEALLICERHQGPIHLMVTDTVMPQMSGRELAKRLASPRPAMKVLYVSGYTDNAIVHHGVLDPGIAFLQKPFTPDGLARKVREVLDASRDH